MKICLACSSGGHLAEIMELKEVYARYNHFFVSYKSADTIELRKKERVYFLINPRRNPTLVMQNFLQSLWMFIKERPDIVITTGGGVALATCYIAKLFRKRIIFIESMARIKIPSLFGKLVYPIADLTIVQWTPLLKYYKRAIYGGFIFNLPTPMDSETKTEEVKDQIFVAVGTYLRGFNRLLKELDHLVEIGIVNEKVIAQIGYSSYEPRNCEWFRFAPREQFIDHIRKSKIIITHGGVGSIIPSLQHCKTTIAVARYKRYNEVIDDHQSDTIKYLEDMGSIIAVYDIKNLGNALKLAETFKMRIHNRGSDNNIINIINRHICTLNRVCRKTMEDV